MKYLYHSYQDAVDFFSDLARQSPNHVRVEVIGETWEKREIILVTLSADIQQADEKPALFYTGTIHAREYVGVELAIAFASHVVNGMNYDPRIQEAFQRSTIYMVPCANPDGLEFSRDHFSNWRKNRRVNADGSIGVDLNRNFPIGFRKSNTPSSNVYSGPHPFSEPETCALRDFVEAHDNITIALDYHSQGNVFFPAHDFRHESTIDTTDMNVLCANMADEIRKVSGREYGIHQGKPPATLVSGSGREFYYSLGIIGTVVEVGTENISDYLNTMTGHINEHIPALLAALKEVPNYAKDNPLQRPKSFQLEGVEAHLIALSWDYENLQEDTYFEIYRSKKFKTPCNRSNLLSVTRALNYVDNSLESSCLYYYRIRAVDRSSGMKSPFAPFVRVMTHPGRVEMAKTLFPIAAETGYLGERIANNKGHFGYNSLFSGINTSKGECISLMTFPLNTMPKNALIKSVQLNLYPINRVSATIERFGEWVAHIVDIDDQTDITDFQSVKLARKLTSVGRPTKSQHLTQGIWRNFKFSHTEAVCFEEEVAKKDKVSLLLEGPSSLLPWRDSQMMQWDIGYGKFGYGLAYRPHLEIVYSLPATQMAITVHQTFSTLDDQVLPLELQSGFSEQGSAVSGFLDFSVEALPDYSNTVIESAYLELTHKEVTGADKDIRLHLEMTSISSDMDISSIKEREVIQKIGSEISVGALNRKKKQLFPLDAYAVSRLEDSWEKGWPVAFAIVATSAMRLAKNTIAEWHNGKNDEAPRLVLNLLNRRRGPVADVTQLILHRDGDVLKLSWDNPTDPDFRGVIVVKNSFRVPKSPYDGQKIYGGQDNYTTDRFGSDDVEKYYAVFTYDWVPNFSLGVWQHYTLEDDE
jgi:hypothetical protein